VKTDKNNIYLDYSATTPLDPKVFEVMKPYFLENFGNASSVHSYGRKAKIALEESRQIVAKSIGAEPGEVFFTSGGTEADNHALIGTAFSVRRHSPTKNHLIVSSIEHHAVLHTADYLSSLGFLVTKLPVNEYGLLDPSEVENALRPESFLVSVMHANNEIGTIQPISAISSIVQQRGIFLHSDTVQSAGKIAVNVHDLGADFIALSAHKFYGPKGIGALYIRKGMDPDSLLHGGSQERKRRAGTENVALAVGFAAALENSLRELEETSARLWTLKTHLVSLLKNKVEGIIFNGHPENCLPTIVNISFDSKKQFVDGEALILNMDLNGVAVTSGSACTSGSIETSHVLRALGRDEGTARASIRFSLGKYTTITEIEDAVSVLLKIRKMVIVSHS
jgi:cysteine desulfurase